MTSPLLLVGVGRMKKKLLFCLRNFLEAEKTGTMKRWDTMANEKSDWMRYDDGALNEVSFDGLL
jgi:hypothetical protein